MTRMMYMSESKMVVADALARIDSVLEAAPMQVQAVPQYPCLLYTSRDRL